MQFFVDFEFRLVRDEHSHPTEVSDAIVEGANRDDIGHLVLVNADERSANPDVFFIDRQYFGKNELLGERIGRCRQDIDRVRGIEVKVELQERRPASADTQLVAVRQADPELGPRQYVAIHVLDHGFLGLAVRLDEHLGVRVVEPDPARHVGAGGDSGRRYELGQVDIIREIDARCARQGLDDTPVGHLEFERQDINRVVEKIAVGVRESDQHGAAFGISRGVAGVALRGSDGVRVNCGSAPAAAGDEKQGYA